MADAGKEEMRLAFLQKVAQLKLELEFTQLHSKESFADLVACLMDWDTLSGGERAERTVSIYGEINKSKGYKLASKYQLLIVKDVPHVLEKFGKGGQVPVALGGAEGEEETSDAVDVRRVVFSWCSTSRAEASPAAVRCGTSGTCGVPRCHPLCTHFRRRLVPSSPLDEVGRVSHCGGWSVIAEADAEQAMLPCGA